MQLQNYTGKCKAYATLLQYIFQNETSIFRQKNLKFYH